jgi:hypothetical protein
VRRFGVVGTLATRKPHEVAKDLGVTLSPLAVTVRELDCTLNSSRYAQRPPAD